LEFITTVQVPLPLQAPLQPTNVEPALGVAVNITPVPAEKFAAHLVVGQLMPAGLLVTVPPPVPPSATLRANDIVVPVPVSVTVCVLPGMLFALSVKVTVEFSFPGVEGLKITETVHDEFGANCPPAELHVSPGPSKKSPGATA
jgi:hypothetical protein